MINKSRVFLKSSSITLASFLVVNEAFAYAAPAETVMDSSREVVADKVVSLARGLDSLFGDQKLYDDYESSTLILEQGAYIRENSIGTDNFTIRLNLKLPQAQKKVDKVGETIVEVGKDVVETTKKVAQETLPDDKAKNKKSKIVTTPKRKRADEDAWKFSQESGLRIANPLYYFFKVRARRNFKLAYLTHSFSEEFGWFTDNKWAENTQLLSDYVISEDKLFRIINEKTWYLSNGRIETTHGFSLYKSITEREAISFNTRAFLDLDQATFTARKYTVGVTHSRVLNRDWVTLETTPQFVFLREKNFKGYWEILFKLGFAIGRD